MPHLKIKLNTTSSVVDFLKSQDQESSFTARRKLFQERGLKDRLGEFIGSSSQNLALLRVLRQQETQPALPKEQIGAPAATALQDISRPGTTVPPDVPGGGLKVKDIIEGAIKQGATEDVIRQTFPNIKDFSDIQFPSRPRFDLTEIPQRPPITGEDVLRIARGQTDVRFAEEEAQLGKERLEAGLPGQLRDIRSKFASAGLFFSGERTVAEQGVRDEALSKELDIDLRFAKVLGTAIDKAKDELDKDIEDVIEGARKQRKEEIDFLGDIGLAVDPRTGELFQTRIALNQAAIQDRFEFQQAQIERRFQERSDAIQRRFEETQARLASQAGRPTKGDKNALAFDDIKTSATKILVTFAANSASGFTDPKLYKQFRDEIAEQVPQFLDDFDDAFSVLLDPSDALRLGVFQDDPFEAIQAKALREAAVPKATTTGEKKFNIFGFEF